MIYFSNQGIFRMARINLDKFPTSPWQNSSHMTVHTTIVDKCAEQHLPKIAQDTTP